MWNGKTIAVLGNGPKCIFPETNEEIYKRILKNGGAIVSEYPDDEPPKSDYFRKRNRIVSGLSLGILVVEAEKRSGTSITARFAREQNRDVFCIPNSRENRKGYGTNILLQKGATLVIEPNDIIKRYTGNIVKQVSIEELEANRKIEEEPKKVKQKYKKVYNILSEELTINEISKKIGMDVSELYQKLLMMEIDGIIEITHNKYRRK